MTAANAFGRQVVDYLTNKSGGGVIAGDVVVIDTTNDAAFTTTTSAGFTGGVGIAQETIADNAAGRVLRYGYAALVNVNASVTRGNYGKTHTVAKQATGSASRGIGTFCQFLTGGTTPTATLFSVDLLGTSLTNPMTTTGDIIYSSDNSGTPARLGGSNSGFVLTSSGATSAPTWAAAGSFPTTATADCSANVSLSTDTPADATSASISLVAGTWQIFGQLTIDTGAANYCLMYITNSSNTAFGEARNVRNTSSPVTLMAMAVVSPGSTTTYKLRGQCGASGTILRYAEGTTVGTRIWAIRTA